MKPYALFLQYLVAVMLAVVGVIHLLPLSGALGIERLTSLYGLEFSDPSLVILMRHRAVLFGLLGLFMIVAAFRRSMQPAAFIGGFASVVSFLYLALSTDAYNAQLERVVVADTVALICLFIGLAAYVWLGRTRDS